MHNVAQGCIDCALARTSFLEVNCIPIPVSFSLIFMTMQVGKVVLYCFSFYQCKSSHRAA